MVAPSHYSYPHQYRDQLHKMYIESEFRHISALFSHIYNRGYLKSDKDSCFLYRMSGKGTTLIVVTLDEFFGPPPYAKDGQAVLDFPE